MTMTDVVPLPDYLATCGCPGAPTIHNTTCAVAIEFEAIPLRDRPEYVEGARFAAITWAYPLRISGSVRIEVALDPIGVIRQHSAEYERFRMEPGYEDWEKPILFICSLIEDQCDVSIWFGGRRLSSDYSDVDDLSEYPRWTPADTARLNEEMATLAPDPNQATLDFGTGD